MQYAQSLSCVVEVELNYPIFIACQSFVLGYSNVLVINILLLILFDETDEACKSSLI